MLTPLFLEMILSLRHCCGLFSLFGANLQSEMLFWVIKTLKCFQVIWYVQWITGMCFYSLLPSVILQSLLQYESRTFSSRFFIFLSLKLFLNSLLQLLFNRIEVVANYCAVLLVDFYIILLLLTIYYCFK